MSTSSIYGSAAAPITISGIASGIDSSSIISELTKEESGVETQLQSQQTVLNSKLTAWQTFNATLLSLQTVTSGLSSPATFNTATATIDQSAVASVTASAGAAVGSHTLAVTSLAQTQQVLSGSFTDSTTPVGGAGSFVLNGHTFTLGSTDTLTSLATEINAAGAGVQASVVNASDGNYQLSLTASSSGAINAISATDASGSTALESLGFVPTTGAATALRQSVTGGAGSLAYANSTATIGSLTSAAGNNAASGTVKINGTSVSLNLNTMSLTDVANAINAAGISGVQAQVVGVAGSSGSVSASSPKQIQIVATGGASALTASSFTDSGGVLASLGIVQSGFANQVTAAQDASFTLDGVNYKRASNTVSNAIPDVAISLLSTSPTTTATGSTTATPTAANITVSADTSSVATTVSNFVTAYNGVIDGINAQETYSGPTTSSQDTSDDTDTSQSTPPLFGDFTLQDIQNQLSSMLSVTNGSTTFASIGLTVGTTGDLTLDSSKLESALGSNPSGVAGLFSTIGSATGSDLTYASSGSSTQASAGSGYAVNVTQAATQASAAATTPYQTLAQPETLTFSTGLFGSAATKLTLASGTTLAEAVAAINGNANLNQFIYAAQSTSGALQIASKGYGSNQSFTVTSSLAAGAGTSGVGLVGLFGVGKDVMGTINNEAATGNGQSLIGNSGDKTTAGLQVTYTGTGTGNVGSVAVTQGLAAQLNAMITSVTDTSNGSIIDAENAINSQVSDLTQQITESENEVNTYESQLQTEFANMETAISALKSQQSAIDAEVGDTTASSSSTGTSSSSGSSSSASSSSGS